MNNCFTPRMVQTSKKNLDVNCEPLSVSKYTSGPHANTQCSQNTFATVGVLVFVNGAVRVSLLNLSVSTNRNLLCRAVRGNVPRRSMQMNSSGRAAENKLRNDAFERSLIRLRAQSMH